MSKHLKLHSFTGTTDHDFTGLVANQILEFNGTNIASLNTATAGAILYVSSDGDDATAVKGDVLHPYANIYAAKSASTSGDAIYVLPQTIVYDNRNTAGNPYNGQIDTLVNLWKDGVTYYFSPGSKVTFYNQTVTGEPMYLFSPGTSTGETCSLFGELEWEGNSTGADSSNGHAVFFWQDVSDGGFNFKGKVKKLTSFGSEIVRAQRRSGSSNLSTIHIEGDEMYHQYLGGQSGNFAMEGVGVAGFTRDPSFGEFLNYTSKFKKRSRIGGGTTLRFAGDLTNSKINFYGDSLLVTSTFALFYLNSAVGVVNVDIKNMYYVNTATLTSGSGPFTLNLKGDFHDNAPNSDTDGLFLIASDGNTINYNGNITTNTIGGVGRYISSINANGNVLNINGDINFIGTGTTTQIHFQANGSSTINYTGKITGNFASSGIGRPRNGGTVNLNNAYIESNVDGLSSVFTNNTTVLGTGRLNNSYVRLTNNTSGVLDGEDNNIFINNSTVINLGTGSTMAYNTTNNGDLQILNSTLISSYSGATSIAYTGATTVISSNSTVNTNFDITDLKGNITTLTDLIY
jgi:hypothetical protein